MLCTQWCRYIWLYIKGNNQLWWNNPGIFIKIDFKFLVNLVTISLVCNKKKRIIGKKMIYIFVLEPVWLRMMNRQHDLDVLTRRDPFPTLWHRCLPCCWNGGESDGLKEGWLFPGEKEANEKGREREKRRGRKRWRPPRQRRLRKVKISLDWTSLKKNEPPARLKGVTACLSVAWEVSRKHDTGKNR